MARKNITLDLDAYEQLIAARRENESLSEVIKRVISPPFDYKAWLKSMELDPISDDAAKSFEEIIESRRRSTDCDPRNDLP